MPITQDFDTASTPTPKNYSLSMVTDHVVQASSMNQYGYAVNTVTYDFLNRLVVVSPQGGDNRTFTFAEFDAGAIEWHYHKMVEAGKHPRPPASVETKPDAPKSRPVLQP